jgi:hypothetical protein
MGVSGTRSKGSAPARAATSAAAAAGVPAPSAAPLLEPACCEGLARRCLLLESSPPPLSSAPGVLPEGTGRLLLPAAGAAAGEAVPDGMAWWEATSQRLCSGGLTQTAGCCRQSPLPACQVVGGVGSG